jgi:hypothetical protein
MNVAAQESGADRAAETAARMAQAAELNVQCVKDAAAVTAIVAGKVRFLL